MWLKMKSVQNIDVVLVWVTNMIASFVFLFEAQIHGETEKLVIMSAPDYMA